eukprot:jgi/Mesen1/1311/ME000013S00806
MAGVVPVGLQYAVHALGVLVLLATCYWTWEFRGGVAFTADKTKNWPPLFNWHPLMMQLGFVVFFSEAALIFRSSTTRSKATSKAIHMALQIAALVLGVVAIAICYVFKGLGGFAHFYSIHSWLGLLAIFGFAVQVASGFSVFWWPGGQAATRAALLPWHLILGVGLYVLMLITVAAGFQEKVQILMSFQNLPSWAPESVCINIVAFLTFLLFGVTLYAVSLPRPKAAPSALEGPREPLLS